MSNTDNLVKRHNTWSVRVIIPKHLRDAIGLREITKSLKTPSLAVANRLKHPIIGEARKLIAVAELSYQSRQSSTPASNTGNADADALLAELGLLRRRVLMGMVTPEDSDIEHDVLVDRAYNLQERTELPSTTTDALSHAFYAAADTSIMPLSEAIDLYLEERKSTITQATYKAKKRHLKTLQDYVGSDIDIRKVSRQQAGQYVTGFLHHRDLTVRSMRIVLANISAFFGWAEVRGMVDENPFRRMSGLLSVSSRGTSDDRRRPFTHAELLTLVQSVEPTTTIFTMIVLGMYTGCRLNELAEILVSDVHDDHIYIRESKSQAGVRQVPIHPIITPLTTQLTEVRTDDYLVSGLFRSGDDSRRGKAFSQQFSYHKRVKLHMPSVLAFHSLRGSFVTSLESASVPQNVMELLVGHSRSALVYGTYSAGLPLEQLAEAVSKVSYGNAVDTLVANKIQTLTECKAA